MPPRVFTTRSLAGKPTTIPWARTVFTPCSRSRAAMPLPDARFAPRSVRRASLPTGRFTSQSTMPTPPSPRRSKLGGKILAPAFDVMDAGRMAVIQDPTGAVFCAWQPKNDKGIAIAGVAGSLCWADLSTSDAKRAVRLLFRPFRMADLRRPKRSFRLPAHQKRRAFHRRHSARRPSPARSAAALAGVLPSR